MQNPKLLGILVVIAGVLGFLLFAGEEPASEPVPSSEPVLVNEQSGPESIPVPRGRRRPPEIRENSASPPVRGAVRDHRSNPSGETPVATRRVAKGPSPVAPSALVEVHRAIAPLMKQCTSVHSASNDGSRALAVISVSIADELVRINTIEMRAPGVQDAEEATRLQDCVQNAVVGHEQKIAGSKNTDSHVMTFHYNL